VIPQLVLERWRGVSSLLRRNFGISSTHVRTAFCMRRKTCSG